MSCVQSLKGLVFDQCEANLAGVKNVYLTDMDAIEDGVVVDLSAMTVSSITSAVTFYHYGMDEQTGYLTSTSMVGDNGRIRGYTNEIRLAFPKITAEKQAEFFALTHNPVRALVEDNNGIWHYVSYDQWMRASDGATAQTGQSYDDENGYEVIISGRSAYPSFIVPAEIAKAVISEPDAVASN